jgi:putative tricarboxylic transport membrane protein
MLIELLVGALEIALSPPVIAAVLFGVVLGITVGAVPGISGDMAMALLLPFVFTMDTAPAIGMLMGVYKGSLFGGSISAIMFGVPGTPGAAATILDGFPAKQAGMPNRALHTGLYSSVIGDFGSVLVLIFIATPLALLALKFGPREFFALYVASIIVIASLDRGKVALGFAAAAVGILLSMVGRDPFSGAPRYAFGSSDLAGGLGLVPVLIGLFAVSEIMLQVGRTWRARLHEEHRRVAEVAAAAGYDISKDRLSLREYRGLWRAVLTGVTTGTIVGALPGAGATLAGFLSYGLAKRFSREAERFGKGSLEGIAAPEAGNSATAGATLIPLFAFGVPGSGSAALIGAAFIMQGISPGPTMIESNLTIVYAIFVLLLYGSVFTLVASKLLLPYYARISMIHPRYVLPVVLGLALLGTYATSNSVFDVWVLIAAGLVGVAMRSVGMPIAAVALGFILGPGLERALRQSLILGFNEPQYFVGSPIAAGIYLVAVGVLALFFWVTRR